MLAFVLPFFFVCFSVDNSEYMRNGDFIPSRLQAQQDAVSLVCHAKLRSNPENNVALLTLGGQPEVLSTLTTDVGRLLSKLHAVSILGDINFLNGIRIAHLALKHRQGKNHKMRIVCFVGSPVENDDKELVKIAKKLKKEKVNVDVINFGEEVVNTEKLSAFIKVLEGTGSHMVTVPSGNLLSDALFSSPVIVGEDGAGAAGLGGASGFEFGIDPNEDPELALALRVSMEEQRQRQDEETRQSAAEPKPEVAAGASTTGAESSSTAAPVTPSSTPVASGSVGPTDEEMLEQALAMSMQAEFGVDVPSTGSSNPINLAAMTEQEQIEYALQMSMQNSAKEDEKMETDEKK